MNLNDLEQKGFEIVAEIDNYYPEKVKSGKYTFKTIYYNEETNEIKAVMRKTLRSKTLEIQEIPLEEIRVLDNKNPLKIALSLLEENDMNNSKKIFENIERDGSDKKRKIKP